MNNDTIPAFLTVSKAAELSGYDEADINTAIAAGDLQAADPIGKGLRIPRLSFEEWMSGAKIPPWEGKAGDWIEVPLHLVSSHLNFSSHPEDSPIPWIEHDELLRLRVHAKEDKVEVTWQSEPRATPSEHYASHGSPLVEFALSIGAANLHVGGKLGPQHGQRRIIESFPNHLGEEDERGAFQEIPWDKLRKYLLVSPPTCVPADIAEIVRKLPSKVMGIDVARALGIMAPHAGHYRMISDAMKALGWSSKRTNKGWAYFAPTFMGQVQKHFGSAEE